MAATNKRTNEAGQAGGDQRQKRFKSKYTSTITVIVAEDDDNIFTPHEQLICANSEFFKAACSEEWRKDQARVVRLPAPTRPEHFQHYLDWLYSQRTINVNACLMASLQDMEVPSEDNIREIQLLDELVDLWILGDFLLDLAFKNQVINSLLSQWLPRSRLMPMSTIRKVIMGTPQGCGIYRWTLRNIAALANVVTLREMKTWLPVEVHFELLERVVELRIAHVTKTLPTLSQREDYYDKATETH